MTTLQTKKLVLIMVDAYLFITGIAFAYFISAADSLTSRVLYMLLALVCFALPIINEAAGELKKINQEQDEMIKRMEMIQYIKADDTLETDADDWEDD